MLVALLWIVVTVAAVGLPVLIGLLVHRRIKRRHAATTAGAAAYGFFPPQGLTRVPGWTRFLPDPDDGLLTQLYVAQYSGRPAALAEYRVSTVRPTGTKVRYYLSVAVVGLRRPQPLQNGPGRPVPWYVTGPDVLGHRKGRLDIASMLPVLDELTAVAARLD